MSVNQHPFSAVRCATLRIELEDFPFRKIQPFDLLNKICKADIIFSVSPQFLILSREKTLLLKYSIFHVYVLLWLDLVREDLYKSARKEWHLETANLKEKYVAVLLRSFSICQLLQKLGSCWYTQCHTSIETSYMAVKKTLKTSLLSVFNSLQGHSDLKQWH